MKTILVIKNTATKKHNNKFLCINHDIQLRKRSLGHTETMIVIITSLSDNVQILHCRAKREILKSKSRLYMFILLVHMTLSYCGCLYSTFLLFGSKQGINDLAMKRNLPTFMS